MDSLIFNSVLSGYVNLKFTKFILGLGSEKQIFYLKKYGDKILEVSLFYSRLSYSFTDKIFSRLIITYYKGETGIYPLFAYQINPFTVFYLGANINTMKYPDKMEGKDHQIFLKFQYVFKI